MREAKNIIALQQTETPLIGGENAPLLDKLSGGYLISGLPNPKSTVH